MQFIIIIIIIIEIGIQLFKDLQGRGGKGVVKKCRFSRITVVGDSEICVPITGSIRNVGAYFDSDLSMNAHVTKVCQAIHFHLRNIGKVRKYLDFDTTTILVHSLVTSRLDNCNSLLLGVPKQTLNRLLMVQNLLLGSLLCQSGEIMSSLSLSLSTGFQ